MDTTRGPADRASRDTPNESHTTEPLIGNAHWDRFWTVVRQLGAFQAHRRDNREAWDCAGNGRARLEARRREQDEQERRTRRQHYAHTTANGDLIEVTARHLPINSATTYQWRWNTIPWCRTVRGGQPVEPDWTEVADGSLPLDAFNVTTDQVPPQSEHVQRVRRRLDQSNRRLRAELGTTLPTD